MADEVATGEGFFSDAGGLGQFRTLVNAIDDGLYQLDPRGHFVAVNEVIADVTGYEREELLGRHVSVVLDDAEVERVETTIRGLLGSEPDTATLDLSVETADGEVIPCELRLTLLVEDGEFRGTVGVVRDVSERLERERRLVEAEQRFRSLVDAVEEYAIFMLDPDGHVVSWNRGARRLKGYERREILGKHFSTFYTERDREEGIPEANLAVAREEGSTEDEGWRVRADGSRFWANVTIRPLRDDDGALLGYAKVTRDMTERKRAEAERELLYETTRSIAEAETFADGLQAALRRICAATDWEYGEAWVPTGDVLRRADAEYYEPDLASFASFSESVTFEEGEGMPGRVWASGDYEWVSDLSEGSADEYPRIDQAREVGMQSALGVPIVADGEVLAVLTFLTSELRMPDERAVELVSSVATKLGDLVRRRRAEQAHRREQELTERVLATSPVGIAVFSADGEIQRVNDRMNEVLGMSGKSLGSYDPGSLDLRDPDGDPLPVEARPVGRVIATGEPVVGQEMRIETDDGRTRWLSANATPITDETGDLERVVTTATDVTQLKAQARRLERQRDDLESELEEVFERISNGFFALDGDLRFTYVNDRAESMLGTAESSVIGRDLRDVVPVNDRFERALQRALAGGEPTVMDVYYDPLDAWFESAIYPSETGVSVYFRDVTERKERERELVRYETLFEESKDVNVIVEPDGTFRYLTPSAANVFGYDPEELVGEIGFEYIHPDDREAAMAEFGKMIEMSGYEPEIEFRFEHADGSWIVLEALARDLRENPDVDGIVIYTRDVTDRKERQQELERALDLLEKTERIANVAGWEVDPETEEPYWSDHLFDLLDVDYDEQPTLEEALDVYHSEEDRAIVADAVEEAMEMGEPFDVEARFPRPTGDVGWLRVKGEPEVEDGDVVSLRGAVQDVTERKEREQELEQYRALTQAASDVIVTIDEDSTIRSINPAVEDVFGYEREELLGEPLTALMPDELAADHPAGIERYLRTGERAIDWEYVELPGVRADGTEIPLAISFSEAEYGGRRYFTGIVRDVSERKERERELERQRERLAALNSLHEVVQDVAAAAVEQSTREEIEEIVCERLAESDSYRFAWVGDVDPRTETVQVRAEAGVEGYLDGITISTDPDDERSQGPTGRAVHTGEIQTTRDVRDDPRHDPWREQCEEHGFRSSAAIPIVHDGTRYGVLNVYADRPGAFTGEEREVVGTLGEIVGHAIAAVERKRALLSDEVVELDLLVEGVLADLDPVGLPDGRIEFDQVLPVGDDEYLAYGTADESDLEVLEALVDELDNWQSVRVVREGRDRVTVELRVVEPPLVTTIAARGGSIEDAYVDGEDFYLTVHLPRDVDTRAIVDAVDDVYPGLTLQAQRQVTRTEEGPRRVAAAFAEELTDRQRAAVEAAYFAGYFDWPRESSGQEVAESLDISPATFSQHLRTAEQRIFEALFEDAPGDDERSRPS